MDWVASQRLFFGVRGGYYMSDQHDTQRDGAAALPLRRRPATSASSTCPSSLQQPARVHEHPDQHAGRCATSRRARYFQADGTVLREAGRRPPVQVRRPGRPRRQRRPQRRVAPARLDLLEHALLERRPLSAAPTATTTVRSNGVDPTQGLHHRGQHPHHQHRPVHPGCVDDQQQADGQRRPPHRARAGADLHDRRRHPGVRHRVRVQDKLAPRVGFAYDINGDGKWKAFGSWGVFYDIFKLELPRGSFGGDKWLDVLLHARHARLAEPPGQRARARRPAPGTLIRGPDRLPSPVVRLGLDRSRTSSRCASRKRPLGLDHQLNNVMAVERPLRPQADRPRDRRHGLARRRRQRDLHHRQPRRRAHRAGVDRSRTSRCRRPSATTTASSSRSRSGSPTDWYLRTSYLWSRLYGNYSGLSQSDENGRTSPNVGRAVRLSGDDVPGRRRAGVRAAARPIGRTSSRRSSSTSSPFGTSIGAEPVRGERPAGEPRDRHLPDQQPAGSVPGPRQRRPDADRTRRPTCSCSTASASAGSAAVPAQPQRAQPVQPEDRGQQVLDVSERQRRRPERGALLPWPADARAADRHAERRRRIRASCWTTCSSRRSRRASASSSPSRPAEGVRLSCAPRASARGAFFLPSEDDRCASDLPVSWLSSASVPTWLSAQPQRNQNREPGDGAGTSIGLEDLRVRAVGQGAADFHTRDRHRPDLRDGLLRARRAH